MAPVFTHAHAHVRVLVGSSVFVQVSVMIYPEHGLADQHGIPWWIILIAVLAGVMVLALLVCVLWKVSDKLLLSLHNLHTCLSISKHSYIKYIVLFCEKRLHAQSASMMLF